MRNPVRCQMGCSGETKASQAFSEAPGGYGTVRIIVRVAYRPREETAWPRAWRRTSSDGGARLTKVAHAGGLYEHTFDDTRPPNSQSGYCEQHIKSKSQRTQEA